MVAARERGGLEIAVLVFGLLSLTLLWGAFLWIGLKFYRWAEGRKARRARVGPNRTEIPATYAAQYPVQDRVVAGFMAAFFSALTAFFVYDADHVGAVLISTFFFCFSLWYTAHLVVSRVLFTRDRVTARMLWRSEFSEPYSSLRRVSSKPGTLTLHFSDGRLMKLHTGMGDPDMVIAYLSSYAPRHQNHRFERE